MEQILSYKTLFFDAVTTIGYALSPAMNKSLRGMQALLPHMFNLLATDFFFSNFSTPCI